MRESVGEQVIQAARMWYNRVVLLYAADSADLEEIFPEAPP